MHYGPNEAGPTDQAGEYRADASLIPREPAARIPGEVWKWEQPIDVASSSKLPPQVGDLTEAERSAPDPSHIARGKPAMSSS